VDQPFDAPTQLASHDFRVTIGTTAAAPSPTAQRVQHLGDELWRAVANAILALNAGAKKGGFAHDTGEGSISATPPRARRRPDLGDRLGLLRLPQRRRQLQRRAFAANAATRRSR
jgi:hypothetical protein